MSEDTKAILDAIGRMQQEQASFQIFVAQRFIKVDQRFEERDQRFEKMDQRFEKWNAKWKY